jgi:tetratricopeptide (TPR) repeat protein
VSGLTIQQLSKVKTLYKAKLDPELMKQVKEKYPLLLKNVKEGEGEEINACEQAIKTDPDDASAYYDLGNAYRKESKYKEAIGSYKHALRINTDCAKAHYSLGVTYADFNHENSALEQYEILKNIDSRMADELYNLIYEKNK